MKCKICKESIHFWKFLFIYLFIIFWLIGAILIIFHNKLQKNHSKNHSYQKIILGKKTCKTNVKSNACGSFDYILTHIVVLPIIRDSLYLSSCSFVPGIIRLTLWTLFKGVYNLFVTCIFLHFIWNLFIFIAYLI
jgi:hypothetical protein